MILFIEPFYGGSHKQLIDLLCADLVENCVLFTLPAKKWHWRARTSALYFSQLIPRSESYSVLFCSSVLNLAELVALRPDLMSLKKIIYFHENQLAYPVQKQRDRDFQYGYNQILSCLVADVVLFNSDYNMHSFLSRIDSFLNSMPDFKPKGVADKIRPKCEVLYFPMKFPDDSVCRRAVLPFELVSDYPSDMALDECNSDDLCQSGPVTTNVSTADCCGCKNEGNTFNIVSSDSSVAESNRVTCRVHRHTSQKELQQVTVPAKLAADRLLCDGDLDSRGCTHQHSPRNGSQSKSLVCAASVTSDGAETCDIRPSGAGNRVVDADINCQTSNSAAIHSSCPATGAALLTNVGESTASLHIIWPHRWEHDKNPETFLNVVSQLDDTGLEFRLSVIGQTYKEVSSEFENVRTKLNRHIVHWGYVESRSDYYQALFQADVVVSTAQHEFFGVSMLEAVHSGCYPLCPERLVYPEFFPKECLYRSDKQLLKKLKTFCKRPDILRANSFQMDLTKFRWEALRPAYYRQLGLDEAYSDKK